MTVKLDIIEIEGRTVEGIKFLGMVPEELATDDYNVYIRWDGAKVTADRSDTDRNLVASHVTKSRGKVETLRDLFTYLATFYGADVTVQADPGVKVSAMAAKLIGTYFPRDTVHARDYVTEAEIIAIGPDNHCSNGHCGACAACSLAAERHVIPGSNGLACECSRMFAQGPRFEERKCPCGAVFPAVPAIVPAVGDVYADIPSDTTMTVLVANGNAVVLEYLDEDDVPRRVNLSVMAFSIRVRDGDMVKSPNPVPVPVKRCNRLHAGTRCDRIGPWDQCRCLVLMKRPTVKHKSTSKSRARRGGK